MKKVPLVWQIVIGLLLGIGVGWFLNTHPEHQQWVSSEVLKPLGDIFIKMMKMIVVPIVFCCMVLGIAGGGDNKSFGRMGVKSLGYFFAITTLAIIVGLVLANLLEPGSGTVIAGMTEGDASIKSEPATGALLILQNIVPDNLFQSLSEGKLLSILFFAVLFGMALNALPREKSAPVVATLQGTADAMFKLVNYVMAYAPIGVFGMIGSTVATFGFASLLPLMKLIGVVYLALILFALIVLGGICLLIGENLLKLVRYFKDELILACSSAASAAVMPQLMEKLEHYGVPRRIVSFVVPVGYAFNLDGASIFLGVATIFIAQLYGIDLTLSQQILLVVTMVLTSKGAAGVPGFAIIILSATLASAGLPLDAVALVAGIFRVIESGTTTLNVLGNAIAPLVIARWEGVQLKPSRREAASKG
ncbi:cation:dicarboxylase symporter family transporter [Pseudomonas inefficax]|jgi:proton glutamate symport protein|uniref:cation:dicarboxylate symporter family transporter n=1 Tax=Pseudomonas TaxID=286 RepID=UPI000DC4A7C2|nr:MULTISPECIES: cation:dicarboxylase symporter family transporter [Pseudomonas]MBT9236614.1 cation:dicarboxylase symporter family transporter [Pseudomonas sp. MG-2]MCM8911662.1 cation:dicarboxylase symporter family transporter [Pseudomonas inefficax]RAM72019.1 sodium:dicarboxylate symporter [Pseudomonas putida]WNN39521.1 cation:dicarboxylase symporter family transporter [Pseudomonas inefficax]